jgi:hypothetical protein
MLTISLFSTIEIYNVKYAHVELGRAMPLMKVQPLHYQQVFECELVFSCV